MQDTLEVKQMERQEEIAEAKLQALRIRLDEAERDVAKGDVYVYSSVLLDEIDEEEREEHRPESS